MLASKAKWNVLHDENKPSLEDLEAGKDLSSITKELLVQRNIVTEEAVNDFLFPDMSRLHSPHHLTMIEKASKRVHEAISKEEKILVYRSEEHTSELQSRGHLVCRLLLEKKKKPPNGPFDVGHSDHHSALMGYIKDG